MAIEYKDYYAVLGVKKGAPIEEIKQAYRRLAKQHHPDLHADRDKARAGEKFKEINEAYEVLSDPEKRAKYDQIGPGWEAGAEHAPPPRARARRYEFRTSEGVESISGFSDFFEALFGAGVQGFERVDEFEAPRKGRDAEAEMPLTLEEAVRGGENKLTIRGESSREKTITAHLPKNIRDGMKLRLRGQAGTPSRGGQPGDLFLRIKLLPHPLFKVSDDDLETTVTVMPWEAALGAEIAVPTLEGPIHIRVPAGTHAGRRFRIAGKGLGKEGGSRGDLYAVVRIDIPEKTGKRLEGLYREMREAGS